MRAFSGESDVPALGRVFAEMRAAMSEGNRSVFISGSN
jgi:hypothetical protein